MISREEAITMAAEVGDVVNDSRGRATFEFDNHGVVKLVTIAYNRGLTDRHGFVRDVEDAELLWGELSELVGMQAYIERLTAERDSLAEQLEDATDRIRATKRIVNVKGIE